MVSSDSTDAGGGWSPWLGFHAMGVTERQNPVPNLDLGGITQASFDQRCMLDGFELFGIEGDQTAVLLAVEILTEGLAIDSRSVMQEDLDRKMCRATDMSCGQDEAVIKIDD